VLPLFDNSGKAFENLAVNLILRHGISLIDTNEAGLRDTAKAMKGPDDQFDLISVGSTGSHLGPLYTNPDFHGHVQVAEARRFGKHLVCDMRNVI
jgi:hypothetical protein